jgi:hypothetical protein
MAAIISRTAIAHARRGASFLPWLLVVFSADRGTIVSGYQVSSNPPDNVPEDALWSR